MRTAMLKSKRKSVLKKEKEIEKLVREGLANYVGAPWDPKLEKKFRRDLERIVLGAPKKPVVWGNKRSKYKVEL